MWSTDPFLYFLVVLAFLSSAGLVVIDVLNQFNIGNLYNNTVSNVSAKYVTDLTPQPIGSLVTWSVTFVWNIVYTMYLLVSLCLPPERSPVKTTPTLISKSFLAWYIVACLALITWTFTFDREMLMASFALLSVACASIWEATRISLILVNENQSWGNPRTTMIWIVRMLMQNGLAFFAAIITEDALAGLAMALIYKDSYGKSEPEMRGGYSVENGSTAALGGFLVIVAVFALLQNVFFRDLFRYIISVMPALVAIFANIVAKLNQDGNHNRNFQIAATALGVCIGLTISRIVIFAVELSKERRSKLIFENSNQSKNSSFPKTRIFKKMAAVVFVHVP